MSFKYIPYERAVRAFDELINNCETIYEANAILRAKSSVTALEYNIRDLQPVRYGKWIDDKTCSNCGFDILYNYGISGTKCCPDCGADMRGDTE